MDLIWSITDHNNGSLTLCTVPDEWKTATIVPLPKVNNPKTASDMRPISLLPFPGKLLEIIVGRHLKIYLDIYCILLSKQHGFRKKRLTLSAIVQFLHDVYNNLNINKDTYIIFFRFQESIRYGLT